MAIGTASAQDNSTISLADEINQSASGDTITLEEGVYNTDENILIDKDLTITSQEDSYVEINGQRHQIFTISENGKLTLIGLTITNGSAIESGGAIYNYGTLELINCTFTDNRANGYGGAIYNSDGTIIIDNCTFIDNFADDQGGVMHSEYGNVKITDSTFLNNIGERGGVIYNHFGTFTIDNSVFKGNRNYDNSGLGGAIKNWGPLTVTNSVFEDNYGYEGGAIYNFYVDLIVENCTFTNNSGVFGGAIDNVGGNAIIKNSLIMDNYGLRVGGVYTEDGVTELSFNSIVNNSVSSVRSEVTAENNWWGSNEGPENLNVSSWIIMTVNEENRTITVSLNNHYNSQTNETEPIEANIPGTVIFETSDGNTTSKLVNGQTTFTPSDDVSSVIVRMNNYLEEVELPITENNGTENETIDTPVNETTGENENQTITNETEEITDIATSDKTSQYSEKETGNEADENTVKENNISAGSQKTGNPIVLALIMLLAIPLGLKRKK